MGNKKKAILFITISTIAFSFMGYFLKLAGDVPTLQKAFYRNLVAVSFMFFVLLNKTRSKQKDDINSKGDFSIFKPKEKKILFYRALFGTIGIILTYYTIDNMILADSTILTRTSPFFTVIAASIFLGEKLSKRVGIAMVISLFGIILVVKPVFDVVVMFPYIIGITASALVGISYTLLRVLGSKGEDSDVIVFYFSLFAAIVLLPMSLYVYKDMNLSETIYVLIAAFLALVAQVFLTRAYKLAKANDISIYLNLQVIFTAIIGIVFFNEIPDVYSIIGYVIIIGSGYWAFNTGDKSK